MTALSGDALLARNVTDLEGLTYISRSFTYANQGHRTVLVLNLAQSNLGKSYVVYERSFRDPSESISGV
jgi:hypothetical protein